MPQVLLAIQVLLAVLFVAAATAKGLRSEEFLAALRLSRLPAAVAAGLAVAVPAIEVGLAFWLILAGPETLRPAFAATAALLAAFTGWMLWVRARGLYIRCGCFGGQGGEVGVGTVARNAGLLLLAVIGWIIVGQAETPIGGLSWDLFTAALAIGLAVALLQAVPVALPHLVLDFERFQRRSAAAIDGE